MPWDVNAAVTHLRNNAQSTSHGYCAKYTRQAIEAGGVTLVRHVSAKDYGSSLTAVGFAEHAAEPQGGYRQGDVAVIQNFGTHVHGHMQMFDGTRWISDFRQRDFWPGSAYRTSQPSFKIYRYPQANSAPPTPTAPVPNPTPPPPTPDVIESRPYPGWVVQSGAKGSTVRDVQRQLILKGYRIADDGDFGPKTREAVCEFQRQSRLTVDGKVGPNTWAALFGN